MYCTYTTVRYQFLEMISNWMKMIWRSRWLLFQRNGIFPGWDWSKFTFFCAISRLLGNRFDKIDKHTLSFSKKLLYYFVINLSVTAKYWPYVSKLLPCTLKSEPPYRQFSKKYRSNQFGWFFGKNIESFSLAANRCAEFWPRFFD